METSCLRLAQPTAEQIFALHPEIRWAGPLDSVVARYQKFIMITTKLPGHYLCVTLHERSANDIQGVLNALQAFKD